MNKVITYEMDSSDLLRRYVTLADLLDFVEGIVRDNPGANPSDVTLRMERLTAVLVTRP